jgi:hypothetical protein
LFYQGILFLCFFGAPSDVRKKALETGISPHRGRVGGPGGDVRLPETSRDSKIGLWKLSFFLYGSFVRGTWREGYLLGTLKDK